MYCWGRKAAPVPFDWTCHVFTLVGATTRAGLLSAPLRDRFGIIGKLEFYKEEELEEIVLRSAKVLSISIDKGGAKSIALRSRGTPRLANRLLKRVRDFAEIKYNGVIHKEVAEDAWTYWMWIP